MQATPLAVLGPISGRLDILVKAAVEAVQPGDKQPRAAIVLDTYGGVVELVERMVGILRRHFDELHFIVPDKAMSAGTVFAMSGDAIWMDYFSCLGPIDTQIEKDGKLVPALSYVVQFESLKAKAAAGTLTAPEIILLQKLDLADLHFYEQPRDLSVSLLEEWLSRYKFKDWQTTQTRGLPVDDVMWRERAKKVAQDLSAHTVWKTHGRPLSMRVLTDQLNLRIDDLATNLALHRAVKTYFGLLVEYSHVTGRVQTVHTPGYCL